MQHTTNSTQLQYNATQTCELDRLNLISYVSSPFSSSIPFTPYMSLRVAYLKVSTHLLLFSTSLLPGFAHPGFDFLTPLLMF